MNANPQSWDTVVLLRRHHSNGFVEFYAKDGLKRDPQKFYISMDYPHVMVISEGCNCLHNMIQGYTLVKFDQNNNKTTKMWWD